MINRILFILIAVSFLFPVRSEASSHHLLMLGRTVNYCAGNNGILMVGKQATECCTYTGTANGEQDKQSATVPCPTGPVPDSQYESKGQDSISVGDALIGNTTSLNSNAPGTLATTVPEDTDSSFSAQSSAATDTGKVAVSNSAEKEASGAGVNGVSGIPSHNGGSAGGGLSGTGMAAMVSGDTSKSVENKAAEGLKSAPNDEGGASYSSGGAGGADRSKLGGSAGTSVSANGGATGNESFGGGSKDSEVVMRSEDPEDYFTKIELDQSIFKIVHARYQVKSSQWVSDMLTGK